MAENPPYIASPGTITTVLTKIQPVKTPDTFDAKFLEEMLNLKGGSPRSFIPFAKRIGLLNPDGTPTKLYRQFRVQKNKSPAIADAMKIGYATLFDRNEEAHTLSRDQLKSLVIEATGESADSKVVYLIVSCFEKLNEFADFSSMDGEPDEEPAESEMEDVDVGNGMNMGLGLSYTINLVLPETSDPAVFNAIFKSLKANLLRGE